MSFATQHRTSWMDVFPPDHLLQDFKEPSAPLLVDIGGSIGADVVEFRRRYPHLPGRVVLQDLPAVIDSARENEEVLSQVRRCRCTQVPSLQKLANNIYHRKSTARHTTSSRCSRFTPHGYTTWAPSCTTGQTMRREKSCAISSLL